MLGCFLKTERLLVLRCFTDHRLHHFFSIPRSFGTVLLPLFGLSFLHTICFCFFFSRPSLQLSTAVEEKASLQVENRSLKEKLSRRDSADASNTAITGKKLLLLQSQMEQLQEENYRYRTDDSSNQQVLHNFKHFFLFNNAKKSNWYNSRGKY